MPLGTLVFDHIAGRVVPPHNRRVGQRVGRPTRQRSMLTDEVQIVQVAANIVPQPTAAAIEHHAILFTVIVVGLVLAPCRLQNGVTWCVREKKETTKQS